MKSIVLTLAKATGGSALANIVAAFSYSGASRLPFDKKIIIY